MQLQSYLRSSLGLILCELPCKRFCLQEARLEKFHNLLKVTRNDNDTVE